MIQSLLQDAGDGGADSTGDEPTAEDLVTGIEGCDPGDTVCSWVRDVTGSDTAADVSDFLVDNVASILLIIVVAALVVGLLKRVIHRAMARLGRGAQLLRPDQPSGSPTPGNASSTSNDGCGCRSAPRPWAASWWRSRGCSCGASLGCSCSVSSG
ncbi:MAG: hypothetical protein M5U19_04440 [Microthrixaceae bacterium]|nr:hypothetical protein [Microthrixaceae bacterium]